MKKFLIKFLLHFGLALLLLFALGLFFIHLAYPTLFTGEYVRNFEAARIYSYLSSLSFNTEKFYEQNGDWPEDLNELIAGSPHLLNNLAITKSTALTMFSYHSFNPERGYGFVTMDKTFLAETYPKNRNLPHVSIRFPRDEQEEWNQQFYVSFPRP